MMGPPTPVCLRPSAWFGSNAIAMLSADHAPPTHLPASLEEKALLTYKAMSGSDDIVVLVETGIVGTTDNAIIIGTNGAFRRASGYSDDQLVGRAVIDLFPVGDDAKALMNAIRGNGSLRSEMVCTKADASTFMLGMHLMPALGRTQGRDCFVILGRDITAALQTRQMQASIQHLLAKVFSSVDAAVAIVNSAGRIVMTNAQVDVLLGYKPNGLVGWATMDLIAAESQPAIAAINKQQFEDGRDANYTVAALRADGSRLAVRITSVIASTGDGKHFRIVTLRPDALGTVSVRSESVGRIKLVGMDEIRLALGDQWPAAAERAMATAEVVIKRNCGPQDSYSRVDESSFLMCFGTLSEEESSFRVAMIGREIRNRLIGQGEDPDNAYVRSIAAVVRFADRGESGASLHALLLDGVDKQLARLEEAARATLRGALGTAACEVEPVFGRIRGQTVGSLIVMPAKLEREVFSALASLPPAESKAFDRDGLLVGLAAQQAVVSMTQGDTMPLLVKISFDIFATRAATERFFELCAKIDPRVTSRLVVLLTSLPEGLPRTRLQDCVNRLRPYCRSVGYQVDDVADLPELDLSTSFNPVVVLPVTACAASSPGKLKEIFSSLQSRRARVLIRGVGSEKDAAALRSLGVDMVCMKRGVHEPGGRLT